MKEILALADMEGLDSRDIARAAIRDGLAADYEPVAGETCQLLKHPTRPGVAIVFDLESDEWADEAQVDGWSYAVYESDGFAWHLITTDGRGLAMGETVADLLDDIAHTLTEWANS